jgi:hypothetical protein
MKKTINGYNFKVTWILMSDDPGESLKETVVANYENSVSEGY